MSKEGGHSKPHYTSVHSNDIPKANVARAPTYLKNWSSFCPASPHKSLGVPIGS